MLKIRLVRYFGRFLPDRTITISVLVSSVVLSVLLFLAYQYTLIRTVIVHGPRGVTLTGVDSLYHKNIFLLSDTAIESILREQNPAVRSVTIERVFPDLIGVTPVFITPVAFLNAGDGYFVVSESAKILLKSRNKPTGLTEVTYYQKLSYGAYQSGQTIDFSDFRTGLAALSVIRNLGLTADTVAIESTNMIRLQVGEKTFLFSSEKPMRLQSYQFERMVRQFAVEGKDFTSLDVRYDKPIVVFAK